jgi:PAS domain S-box-containing protein
MLRTLATYFGGKIARNIEYPLAGTPCELAIGRSFGYYPAGVAARFPHDQVLADHGIEGYAATTLHDVRGAPIGALTVMSRGRLEDPSLAEAMLKIFAARVAAEIERRRSEDSYRAIFDNAETCIFLLDFDTGAIVDANPKACAVYGYSVDELRRLAAEDLSSGQPPFTAEYARRAIGRARAGEVVRGEWHRRSKDGSLHWDEFTLKRVELAGKTRVLAASREITERKSTEAAMRTSEEQYRAIFNASADALVLRDAEFRIVDVNAAYETMSGKRRAEVVGQTTLTVSARDATEPRLELHASVLAGKPAQFETDGRRADGSTFVLEVRGVPMSYGGRPHVLYIGRDVTEGRLAERALRASEEQYRAMFNASTDALVLRDAEFRIVDVNAAYEAMSGKPRAEVIGLADLTLTRDSSVAVARRDLHDQAIAGEPLFFEADGLRPDGTPFVLEVRGLPMRYRGEPHVLYAGRDVTDAKLAERALRASEEQYRSIFNAATDSLVLRDAEFRVVDVNRAYEALSGRSRAEVIGVHEVTMSDPARAAQIRALHERALAGENVQWEARARRKNGEPFDIEVRGVPTLHQGRPHVLYIGRDITERKRAEEALRASEAQYRAIFNATTDALMLRSADFRIVDVNAAYEAMSGYSRAEVVGRASLTFSAEANTASRRALHERSLAGEAVRFEVEGRRKDGGTFITEVRAVPISHGGRPHVLQIAQDITERKRAEAEREALEAQLRQSQKMEAIGQLSGGIAHDFNNILQGILGNLVLAGERQAELGDERLGRYLARAEQSAQRARDLIRQMLTFSRGQSGERRAVAPAVLAQDALRLLRPTLPATIALETQLDEHLPAALVDPVQLEQVLLNLCINARDAMEGTGRIAVAARAAEVRDAVCASCRQRVGGRFLEFSVRDSGPGIAAGVRDRMFDPFFSTKEVGKGSGMGLAMVHGIVHQHGGHVLVDDGAAGGAEFRVLLGWPAARGAAAAPAPASRQGGARPRFKGRVLVADDEEVIREFLGELLGGWGLEVTAHADGAAARDAFAADPQAFDAVITDQTMPRLTGLQLAKQVSRLRPGIPVILCTGYGEDLKPRELEAAGVRLLARKPVEPQQLRELLAALLPNGNNPPT